MAVSPSSDRLPSLNVEIDPDFEPQKRPRSCTWPLPRPELDTGKKELTDVIPEEDDGEEAVNCRTDDSKCVLSDAVVTRESKNGSGLILVEKDKTAPTGQESVDSPLSSRSQIAAGSDTCCDGAGSQQLRKSSSRRNAWGNLSYADLITKAIESSPEKRLTLSQIYDWMVRCVPYFKDKGDNNSSAGWKNSIRHNLSLHSRFIRLQNEGTGKSSWWMINPDGGKGGKGPRRRAVSMDNSSKYAKSRGRAAKKKAVTQAVQEEGHDGSPTSRGSDDLDPWTDFRSRTNSSASTLSGRLSPIPADPELGEVLDDELPLSPMLYSSPNSTPPSGRQPCPAKLPYLADLTGTMNLNDGMSDDLMDGLLDNINLTLSQQTSPRSSSCSTLQRGSSLALDSNISGLSPPNDNYTNGVYGCLSLSGLRQLPMQTIQENTQANFSCTTLFGSQAVQNLRGCCDVMMTQLDPLISQASASASSQSFRQGIATQGCSVNRPGLLHHQPQSQNALLADWRTALSAPVKGELDLTSDTSNLAVKQKFQCFSGDASLKMGSSDSALYSSLNGGGTSLPLLSQDKFSSDLDLDSPDCDNDFTVHNELMDAEGLDVNIDCLISAQNVVGLNVDNFTNTKQAPVQNWVPS